VIGSSGKLVRGGVPALIFADGGSPKVRSLSDAAFRQVLLDKLIEEVNELGQADDLPSQIEETDTSLRSCRQ